MEMREIIREYIEDMESLGGPEAVANEILAALPDMVQDLVWDKSHIEPWDGDFHSTPTKYTIRGVGDESYSLTFAGGFGIYNSPEAAKAAANAHHRETIMKAFGL